MENHIRDDVSDILASAFGLDTSSTSGTGNQTSSTPSTTNTADFITTTVTEDPGPTSYRPFLVFAEDMVSKDLASTMSSRHDSDFIYKSTSYAESPLIASTISPTSSLRVNTTNEKTVASDVSGSPVTPSMTVANAVTAVLLFIFASSVALAFATGWAPRMLGFRKSPPQNNFGAGRGENCMLSPRSASENDPEKLDVTNFTEIGILDSEQTLAHCGATYPKTKVKQEDWLKWWLLRKEEVLARLRRGEDKESSL